MKNIRIRNMLFNYLFKIYKNFLNNRIFELFTVDNKTLAQDSINCKYHDRVKLSLAQKYKEKTTACRNYLDQENISKTLIIRQKLRDSKLEKH